MSIRARRVNSINYEQSESFNLWHDKQLADFLDIEGGLYDTLNMDSAGLSEISIKILKRAVREVKMNKLVKEQLKKDIRWAEGNDEDYILYYCF